MSRVILRVFLAAGFGFLSAILLAQGPSGYLGKRHVLELGGDLSPISVLGAESISAPGASLDYAYVIGRQVAIGGFARFSAFTSARTSLEGTTDIHSRQLGLAFQFHGVGGIRSGALAPIGVFYSFGVGYHVLNFVDGPGAEDAEPPVKNALFVHAGGGYRYVIRDRFVVTPFLRLALGKSTIGAPDAWIGASEWLQPGVRVGALF